MSSLRCWLAAIVFCAVAPAARADKPPSTDSPLKNIRVRTLPVSGGHSSACMCWSDDAKAFYHVDNAGAVRRYRYPELTEEAVNPIGRKCIWISLSAKGLIATVCESKEAWLLDPKTLKEIKKIGIENSRNVVSSPKIAFAYAVDNDPKGSTLTVLDLTTGNAVQRYSNADLGKMIGFDHPVVAENGESLFTTGFSRVFRFALDGANVKLGETSDAVIQGHFDGLSISTDGKHICAPSGGGNLGAPSRYSTHVYAASDLKKPICTIGSGAYPITVGFDLKSGFIFAQNHDFPLLAFDVAGMKKGQFTFEKDKKGFRGETRQILVHPKGRRLLVMNHAMADPKTEAKIFAVELDEAERASTEKVPVPGTEATKAEVLAIFKEAIQLEEAHQFSDAIPLLAKGLRLTLDKIGESDPFTAKAFYFVAEQYFLHGKSAEAEQFFKRSLAIGEKVFVEQDARLADTLDRLGQICLAQRKYADAETYLNRCLAIRDIGAGKQRVETAKTLDQLGKLYQATGRYKEAEALFLRSLGIKEALLGTDHPDVAVALSGIGAACAEQGKTAQAKKFYQRSLTINEKAFGKESFQAAANLDRLASLCRESGEYASAESFYLRSLEIFEKLRDNRAIATVLLNLGVLYTQQGNSAAAEPILLRSLAIYEKIHGGNHPDVAAALNSLSNLYRSQRKVAESEQALERCLKIQEKALGKEHPTVAITLHNLANLYQDLGKYAPAEALYLRSLAIKEHTYGKEHPTVALTLNSLANLNSHQGNPDLAEPLYLRSVRIWQNAYGKNHPEAAMALHNLVMFYGNLGKFLEATRLQTELRQGFRQFLLRELPSMSVGEQQRFLDLMANTSFQTALSLGYCRATDPAMAEASASWLINGKAIALEAQSIRGRLDREITDAEGQAILREIQAIRAREAALALQAKEPETVAKQREELETQRRNLEKKLAQRGSTAEMVANPWLELSDVRKQIPADGVLIDIVHVNVYPFQPKKGKSPPGSRYVAWLIPPLNSGPVRIVDLGSAFSIDRAIQDARKALEETPERLDKRERENKLEADLAAKLGVVSKLVLGPLKPHIGTAKQLILSPDGDLWLLPWAALPTGENRYLVEDYSLRFVVTGRDLVDYAGGKKALTTPALILADPDYNLTPTEVAEAAPKAPASSNGALVAQSRGVRDELRGIGRVKRLPGTAAEARQAFDKLKTLTGREARLYQEGEASETIVKATRSPQVLVLATHGFFLKAPEVELNKGDVAGTENGGAKPPAPKSKKDGITLENPLLRCGLLLAGANKRAEAKDGEDDGVLTGLEIVGLDLRGTQMVVLSACETGVGVVQSGEGVAGLRQAFQLAGAESVLSTLWQISDKATSQLMNTFYDELAKGTARAEALTLAQRQFLQDRRERTGAAHPYFWASFTLTGR